MLVLMNDAYYSGLYGVKIEAPTGVLCEESW
jgi:hypothetical protein